ncbi:hypothetical protein [Modicisalibacter luteus]|uniref:Transposase n=1 Tax=Modicisalibacter luteus TaxID=453962 RepID=A0ABV7M331_9GAMM|nr:hypothetical protein [Halomonas lutea]GHA85483.1 hypothetical protein GCM10007159_03260 [Halomonas lutea]
MSTRYEVTQWRKRLERKGWKNAKRFPATHSDWIEYHAVWQGQIWSGRCRLSDCDMLDWWQLGTHVYLIKWLFEVEEAVWRRTQNQVAGQVVRRLQRPSRKLGAAEGDTYEQGGPNCRAE